MRAYLGPPLAICDGCDQIIELESNDVHFTVTNEAKQGNE